MSFRCFSKFLMIPIFVCVSEFSHAQISGNVFRDFNADGIHTLSAPNLIEPGLKDVTVNAYDVNSNLFSTTTNAIGDYSISAGTGPYRVEFILPNGYFASNGNLSNTTTQFVPAGGVANLGVNHPSDYVVNNPSIITTMMLAGDNRLPKTTFQYGVQVGVQDEPSIVQFHYNNAVALSNVSGLPHANYAAPVTPNNTEIAYAEKVGTLWGVAYQRESDKLFTSAFMRRGTMFGSLGTGGIYVVDNASGNSFTPTASRNFIDVNSIGIVTGADPHPQPAVYDGQTALDLSACDGAAFDMVGKIGIGDIDLSEDGKDLFLTNLYDRKVYKIKINNPATTPNSSDVTVYHSAPWLTSSPCANGLARPFGLKIYRGKLYVGVVCTAENNGSTNDLLALVYELDLSNNVWNTTPVINFPLNYTKGKAAEGTNTGSSDKGKTWNPWFAYMTDDGSSNGNYSRPTPIVSDIEFDVDGSMILGLMDRTGHQIGVGTLIALQDGTCVKDPGRGYGPYISVNSGGDILRAARIGTSSWQIENNGTSNGVTTAGASNGQGIGGGEFYHGDFIGGDASNHQETFVGGLALQAGSNQILGTTYDPFGFVSGGVQFFNNTTGDGNLRYEVYSPRVTPYGGKGNGLGDIELLNAPQPIEIGNRVFMDTDKDGIQDPNEMGIGNVTVKLYKAGATLPDASTTTNANGQYIFSNVLPNTAYEIKILSADFPSGKSITIQDATSSGLTDVADSDASLVGSDAVIYYTTGSAGQNNHTLDFGFKSACSVAFTLATSHVTCNGNNDGTITITTTSGTAPFSYSIDDGATFSNTSGIFNNLAPNTYKPAVKDANGCIKKCN
jgi:SdrD B-like domain/SprB repeat